jgi:hypothetical protein
MAFYDLSQEDRANLVQKITNESRSACSGGDQAGILRYFEDKDTYIRKTVYVATGRMFGDYSDMVLRTFDEMVKHADFRVRQAVVNAAGEIGKHSFPLVSMFLPTAFLIRIRRFEMP